MPLQLLPKIYNIITGGGTYVTADGHKSTTTYTVDTSYVTVEEYDT